MHPRSRSQAYDRNSVLVLLGLVVITALSVVEPGHATRSGAVVAAVLAVRGLWVGRRLAAPDWAALGLVGVSTTAYLFLGRAEHTLLLYADVVALALLYVSVRLSIDRPLYLWSVVATFVVTCGWMALNMVESVSPEGITIPGRYTFEGLNSNFVAYCMAAAVFLLAGVLLELLGARKWLLSAACVAVAGLPVVGLLATGSRGALLAAVASVLALLALPLLSRLRTWWWLTLAGLAAAAWAGGLLDAAVASLLGTDDREDGTLNGRLTMWPEARRAIAESPLLGHGIGTSMERNGGVANHNALLDLGVDLGLVGITCWAVCVALSLRAGTGGAGLNFWVVGSTALLLPILSTGYWHVTAVVWILLAVVSRQPVLQQLAYDPGWLGPRAATAAVAADVRVAVSAARRRVRVAGVLQDT